MNERLRVLAIVQAASITGPVKNLFEFCGAIGAVDPGIDVSLVTYQRGDEENAFIRAARAAGIPISVIPERGAFDRSVIDELKTVVQHAQPDVVQTHEVKSHFLLRLSGVAAQRPWVAFHHGYTAENLKMRAYNELDRWSLRRASHLVTVSRAFEAQLTARGIRSSRITVLQNAVDPAWTRRVRAVERSAARVQLGLGEEDEVVIAIGRLSTEKAHIDLLRAMRILRERRPRAQLLLVGDGPERAALEAEAAGAPVRLFGQVADTAPFYAAADVMALPSLSEGSPNVLLEAMACGVPSVATATGGTPEIVSHEESALLLPPRRPEELAAALGRVLADRALADRLAAKGQALIEERHRPGTRAAVLAQLYRSLVSERRKGWTAAAGYTLRSMRP